VSETKGHGLRFAKPSDGTTNTTPCNHCSALRSYEDLLGITRGGSDGHGHLGMAGAPGLAPFGPDVFNTHPNSWALGLP
jgi:hypothetical protein